MSSPDHLAAVFGLSGTSLTAKERAFFREADPLGFILFQRNCENPSQVRELVAAMRDSVGRSDAPVLIDQEGGRVARLKPPFWPAYPAAGAIAALRGAYAREAAWLSARLIADDLASLGITVDCAPVVDVPVRGADPIIGDRAWGVEPESVAEYGLGVCDGLMAGGILPILKHIPGHGRATVDSHLQLPIVVTDRATLDSTDFRPFRALNAMPWAMTAHVVFSAIDPIRPATLSPVVIGEVIRSAIGFEGVLVSDDLSMRALGGEVPQRAAQALNAGCDVVLHCNGAIEEMIAIASTIGAMSPAACQRVAAGEARRHVPGNFDRIAAERRFAALLARER